MIRRRRLSAALAVFISVCLGLFAAAQSPAFAASAAPAPTAAAHQASNTAGTRAALPVRAAKPASQDPDYAPAGCYAAAPKKGTASCFALVRTSDGHVVPGIAGPPSTALTPAQIQAAYDLPATGQGQTVAVVDAYGYSTAESDLAVFRQQYGLPACTTQNGCFQKVDQQGGTNYPADDAGWSTESALDLDAVSSACPACHILLVEANTDAISDLAASTDEAVALGAKFVSNSYGASDAAVAGQVSDADYDHPGVVVTASTGDVGNVVQWPSSDPNVVAVGGTTLTAAPGTARGWTESAWSRGGSGCSSFEPASVYQSALTTDCANRATADIAADADPNSGIAEYDTLNGGWEQVGGTSLASPLVASMYALAGTPAANTYPVTYPYIHAESDLNDVTTGSDGTCGDVLCNAGAGWDGPTGLGSPNGVAALTTGPQGTVSGKVTDGTGAPLAGASIVLTDTADQLTFRATTDAAGDYQLSVSAGTYAVSASKFYYATATLSGLAVTTGDTATQDITLAKAPEHRVTGKVTDSGNGWPLYAKITVSGDPNGPVFTDPRTGVYSIDLPGQNSYTFDVTPDYPGYTLSDATVAVGTNDLRHDVALTADTVGCTAPGYAYPTQADFDGWSTTPQDGWNVADAASTSNGWEFDNPGTEADLTGGAGNFATADPQDWGGNAEDTDLTSPTFSLARQKNADLKFDAAAVFAAGAEADASVSTDGGATWTPVYQATNNAYGPVDVPLTSALGHDDVQVRFHFSGAGNSLFQLADVSVGQCQAIGGGLIEGVIRDANTHQPINGATVTDSSAPVADRYATATTSGDEGDAKLPGGFYWLYSPKAGRNALTTTFPRYTTVRADVGVFGSADIYNTALPAGRLAVTPGKVSLKAALGTKTGQEIALTNTGTAPIKVTLEQQNLGSSGSVATAPGAGSWQNLPDYPLPVMDNVVGSYEGKLYSVGGTQTSFNFEPGYLNLDKQNYVYTPGATSWTQIADLPQYRTAATGAFLDGTLYVVGGLDYASTGGGATTESTTYAYHPDSDSWSQVANLPQALAYSSAAVYDGQLYVIGGETSGQASTTAAYRYDPASDTWTQIADYPVAMDSGGCGGIVGGVVCAGGRSMQSNGGSTELTNTYVYNPATDTWSAGASMPYPDYLGSYSSANGELQIAGGYATLAAGEGSVYGPVTSHALQYDPVANVWTALPDVPTGAYGAGRGTGCELGLVGGAPGPFPAGTTGALTLPGFDQCTGDDVSWLSESSTTLDLAPGRSALVQVSADAGALTAPGDYAAALSMVTDSPYLYQPVPVTLQATAPASWAQISGTVTDASTGDALPGADVVVSRAGMQPITATTDASGEYDVWLAPGAVTVAAAADGYTGGTQEVTTKPGGDTTLNFALSTD